ncbi:acyltransferase [Novosphingobium sp. ST904]|uniref:acyltransferase family protein n=1 Tax=Novosphingobium sp. ST904 TaxID=1684385 RepID=UPI0009E6CDCA|nr:acyltransferase [Novosphingobium sp. ST904]TCM25691.1 peptidoglycan/LPS O-acetylase OafA/YrhL [Novosphingobium sp. ST904]
MKKHYNLIDLLRFVAATLVLVHHVASKAWRHPNSFPGLITHLPEPVPFFTNFGEPGWVGVEIFFVISGIVIANSAFDRTATQFVIGRASRLYPSVWVCAPLALFLLVLTGALEAGWQVGFLKSMILLPKGPWIDPVFWTLGVEAIFYVVIALWTLQKRVSIEVVSVLLTAWSGVWAILTLSGMEFGSSIERISLLRFAAFFALGIFMWLWSERRATRLTWIAGPFALCLCLAELVLKTEIYKSINYDSVAPVVIWVASFFIMIYSLANASAIRSVWMTGLGRLTYPLYLCHTTVAGAVTYGLIILGFSVLYAFLMGSATAIALAWAIAKFWEPVVASAIKRSLGRATAMLARAERAA